MVEWAAETWEVAVFWQKNTERYAQKSAKVQNGFFVPPKARSEEKPSFQYGRS